MLQDLGFAIDQSETRLGIVVASKERSAVNELEVAAEYLWFTLSLLALMPSNPTYTKRQDVRVSLVTQPARGVVVGNEATLVRVTFQRSVYDNHGLLQRQESISGPELYQQFFDRLSQGVFLEEQSP